jgi:PPK2 family polyphosphate:nucleotide phosphotransferase
MAKKWDTHPSETLRVREGFSVDGFDHAATPGWDHNEDHAVEAMDKRGEDLADLQERLHANGTTDGANRSVLLVLQGMDTAGKGGIVGHVVGMVNPQGVKYHSFGVPTPEERAHDYLWRVRLALPAPGQLGVFDRSHFESVLVERVHELVPREVWQARYGEINAFEADLVAGGMTIVKCALMVSLDEQLRRLEDRLERPSKYWKYNPHDLDERARWTDYMAAYQDMLDRTSTEAAPWYAIPADNKWFARLAITELVATALESQHLEWPAADFDVAAEQARIDALKKD